MKMAYTPDAQGSVHWFNLKIMTRELHRKIEFCVICQGEIRDKDREETILSCGHTFHAICINNYEGSHLCPTCMGTEEMTEHQRSFKG